LKALLALSWTIEHGEADAAALNRASTRRASRASLGVICAEVVCVFVCNCLSISLPFFQGGDGSNYHPHPVDMTNLTLSREMQNMAERLSENAHDIWARKKTEEIHHGGPLVSNLIYKIVSEIYV